MADSRETALEIIQAVLKGENLSSCATNRGEDNAFVTMLLLTSLRHLVYIRKILKTLITKKLSQQNLIGQSALILGATEILYMRTPDYAVINSYVNLTKAKANRYIAGFVNAVLRKIANEKEKFVAEDKGDFFPQPFRELLKRSYPSKIIAAIEKNTSIEPLLDISCKGDEIPEGVVAKKMPLGTIRMENRGNVDKLPGYDEGFWWVQDFSSALPVKMLDDVKGKNVLELCAAPGGKTAQLLSRGAVVTCLDISSERIKKLKDNLKRLKLHAKEIICADGLDFLEKTTNRYDIVVLDAPCSATGTLRRHPEIVHLKKQDDVIKQAMLQKQFLDRIDRVLVDNGVLIYCTCSLCKEEGEEQIAEFLQKHQNFKVNNLQNKIPAEITNIVTKEGYIRVLPQYLGDFGGADGFFVASLSKGN